MWMKMRIAIWDVNEINDTVTEKYDYRDFKVSVSFTYIISFLLFYIICFPLSMVPTSYACFFLSYFLRRVPSEIDK